MVPFCHFAILCFSNQRKLNPLELCGELDSNKSNPVEPGVPLMAGHQEN